MRKLIEGFGAQLEESIGIAEKSVFTASKTAITNVVVAGMGGSGIGGNLITSFVADECSVPITVSKGYDIPAFVGPATLFIACSFSGNTEETTSAAAKAIKAGAKVVTITSGGKMGQIAQENSLDIVTIPGHSNSPRASIGYSFVQLLNILKEFGLTQNNHLSDIKSAVALLKADEDLIAGEAHHLAERMHGRLAIFYGDSKFEGVLLRTQQQIAENSKQLCHTNVFPEMNHNELVGWEFPKAVFQNTVTILLRTSYDHPRTTIRMDVCEAIFRKHSPEVLTVMAKGNSFIVQSIYLIHLLDWTSLFLAELNDVDPFPVDVINFLKNELAKHA